MRWVSPKAFLIFFAVLSRSDSTLLQGKYSMWRSSRTLSLVVPGQGPVPYHYRVPEALYCRSAPKEPVQYL